ncbi:N-acetylglutamate synthase, mitochondrial [Lamellibrachia satsuma]|nr:N-acetylglutamate synthase, mitochondrial [Lamellibrachia satsuma]
MKIIKPSSHGFWTQRMRNLLWQSASESHMVANLVEPTHEPEENAAKLPGVMPHKKDQEKPSDRSGGETTTVPAKPYIDWNRYPTPSASITHTSRSTNGQDLKRFLEEVGTEAKEARYWLKQFQQGSQPYSPFAIVQVESDVFENPEMLDSLGSSLSFLHRHEMKCVVIHGHHVADQVRMTPEELQEARSRMAQDNMMLVSMLESHGAHARPLFVGSGVLQGELDSWNALEGSLSQINTDPIKWAMRSGHIPVLQSIGESPRGQLINLDISQVTAAVSSGMQPRKVIFVNATGGIQDEKGEVIANINLPVTLDSAFDKPWCTPEIKHRIHYIAFLVNLLPSHSSVVITSATKLLTELFTHHGSGTFFKNMETIRIHHSLKTVDLKRLRDLIGRSFGKGLLEDYFDGLEQKLHTLYLSDGYNAAAIVTKEPGVSTPYLDKFAVSLAKQGHGTGEMLWDLLTRDFKHIFWRSRGNNRINPWYFKRCEGSWCEKDWIVFWYGITDHHQSSRLIDYSLGLPQSFASKGETEEDEEAASEPKT